MPSSKAVQTRRKYKMSEKKSAKAYQTHIHPQHLSFSIVKCKGERNVRVQRRKKKHLLCIKGKNKKQKQIHKLKQANS